MPILTSASAAATQDRVWTIPGLPDFNADDWSFVMTDVSGWDDGLGVDAVIVANGGGPGAEAVGPWLPPQRYYQVSGSIECSTAADAEAVAQVLRGSYQVESGTAPLIARRGELERQAFCRFHDAPKVEIHGTVVTFTLPLVATDPFKYGLTTLTATAGGFVVADAFRTYSDGGFGYRTYTAAELITDLPTVASLFSEGDKVSRRVTTDVTGPLTAGSWWVEDAEGQRMWANTSLQAAQTITFDSRLRSASLAGQNIDHLVFTAGPGGGDYMGLRPGDNTYRLIADSAAGSFMTIEALEAYR